MNEKKRLLWVGLGCGVVSLLVVFAVASLLVSPFFGGSSISDSVPVRETTTTTDEPAEVVDSGAYFGTNVPPNYQSLRGDTWSFAVPTNWEEVEALPGVPKSVRLTPFNGDFSPNANILTEPFHPAEVVAYLAANAVQYRSMGATVVSGSRSRVGGRTARDLESEWPARGAVPAYTSLQRFVFYNANAYRLTCSASQIEFETYREECERILGTLDFP